MLEFTPGRLRSLRQEIERNAPRQGIVSPKKRATIDTLIELLRSTSLYELEAEPLSLTRRQQRLLPEIFLRSMSDEHLGQASILCLEYYPSLLDTNLLWITIKYCWGVRNDLIERIADLIESHAHLEPWQEIILEHIDEDANVTANALVSDLYKHGGEIDLREQRFTQLPDVLKNKLPVALFLCGTRKVWLSHEPKELATFLRKMDTGELLSCMAAIALEYSTSLMPNGWDIEFIREVLKLAPRLKDASDLSEWLSYWNRVLNLEKIKATSEGKRRYEFWYSYRGTVKDFDCQMRCPEVLAIDFGTFGVIDFLIPGRGAYHFDMDTFRDIHNEFIEAIHDPMRRGSPVPKASKLKARGGEPLSHKGEWEKKFREEISHLLAVYGSLPKDETREAKLREELTALKERARTVDPPSALDPFVIELGSPSREDPSQREIIEAPADARLLVEAPPGYGKSHVACERILHLIENERLEHHEILVVSFTRVAVRNVRERLAQRGIKGLVDIVTIDQLAYKANEREKFPSGYDESVDAALTRLKQMDVFERSYHHIIIDEAQDTIGRRAMLLCAVLLRAVEHGAGFTVFFDPAQAIYDWSGRDNDAPPYIHQSITRLSTLLTKNFSGHYQHKHLRRLYRTSEPTLIEHMSFARPRALHRDHRHASALFHHVHKQAVEKSIEHPENVESMALFRTRFDALLHARELASKNTPFQLRMGGLPRNARAPWLAFIFNAIGTPRVSEATFKQTWHACAPHPFLSGVDVHEAWGACLKLGGLEKTSDPVVEVIDIALALRRSALPEVVQSLPSSNHSVAVSTIHGSKGLEADHVAFTLFRRPHFKTKRQEGARELYVAMSRARQTLELLSPTNTSLCPNSNGRSWRIRESDGNCEIVVGLERDIERRPATSYADWDMEQGALTGWNPKRLQVIATKRQEKDRVYEILDPISGARIARTSPTLYGDLRALRLGQKRTKPKLRFGGLLWVDVMTCVIDDKSALSALPGVSHHTGMWLSPIVIGIVEADHA